MATFDAVLVGSGINTLTAAALLARDGWSVCVLERSARLGGAIRTEVDYTLPGFTHEVLSSWHPLFQGSAAYAEPVRAFEDAYAPAVPGEECRGRQRVEPRADQHRVERRHGATLPRLPHLDMSPGGV